ncbi:hypothetical protein F5B21DRAFT_505540 [Xylaria acuta]|nr:hypothetical protein F5B21DRAFT_505540 [Xylaria acuta]
MASYTPDGMPYVPTHIGYRDAVLQQPRNQVAVGLEVSTALNQATELPKASDEFGELLEELQKWAENPSTTGEPSGQVVDEPSIPQRQPDREEHANWLLCSTWTRDAASSSGITGRLSAQKATEAQAEAFLKSGDLPPLSLPYPINKRSRFFPAPCVDQPNGQNVFITEETPSQTRSSPEAPPRGGNFGPIGQGRPKKPTLAPHKPDITVKLPPDKT